SVGWREVRTAQDVFLRWIDVRHGHAVATRYRGWRHMQYAAVREAHDDEACHVPQRYAMVKGRRENHARARKELEASPVRFALRMRALEVVTVSVCAEPSNHSLRRIGFGHRLAPVPAVGAAATAQPTLLAVRLTTHDRGAPSLLAALCVLGMDG